MTPQSQTPMEFASHPLIQTSPPKPLEEAIIPLSQTPSTNFKSQGPLKKIIGFIALFFGILIAAAVAISLVFNTPNQEPQSTQEASQKLLTELKKEISLMREEFHQDQEDIYLGIEEIEVSIHSLINKRPESRAPSKPKAPSHETELRRWRYLGSAQMGGSHQAFFNTGKSNIAFEKGVQVLGEWRLSNIENGSVMLSHPEGKSLVLKALSSE